MSIELANNTSGNTLAIDDRGRAAVVIKEPDCEGGVPFSICTTNGATGVAAGAGAAAEVFALRNPSSTKVAKIRRVTMDMWTAATGFSAGLAQFTLKKAVSFTAGPSAGTTTTLTGENCKLDTTGATLSCVAYVADDSVLTSGTEVADDTPIGQVNATISTATLTVHINNGVLFDAKESGNPLVLRENQGFIIYATVPATGVWFIRVTVQGEEYATASI